MSEILIEYIFFLLKTFTIVLAIILIVAQVAALKKSDSKNGNIKVKKLNDHFSEIKDSMAKHVLSKAEYKAMNKDMKKNNKKEKKQSKDRLFVLNFKGDIRASAAEELRDEISAILAIATPNKDKVLIKLESPGGCVHDYGFAASQLSRIRNSNIELIAAVDKMAASGGYLMASVASKIIASPFAVIGSIGVLLQVPNFHKFLNDKKITFEQLTSGNDKRNLTMFGPNTKEDREKAQEQIDQIHNLFIDFVKKYRPNIEPDKVATGKTWHAVDAIELDLVDAIETSDDFIINALKENDVYKVSKECKKKLLHKLTANARAIIGL